MNEIVKVEGWVWKDKIFKSRLEAEKFKKYFRFNDLFKKYFPTFSKYTGSIEKTFLRFHLEDIKKFIKELEN